MAVTLWARAATVGRVDGGGGGGDRKGEFDAAALTRCAWSPVDRGRPPGSVWSSSVSCRIFFAIAFFRGHTTAYRYRVYRPGHIPGSRALYPGIPIRLPTTRINTRACGVHQCAVSSSSSSRGGVFRGVFVVIFSYAKLKKKKPI